MKIGILGAMEEEVSLLANSLSNCKTTEIGGTLYYTGSIGEKEIVIAFSKWGKVANELC